MFEFVDIKILSDGEIDLTLESKKPANNELGLVPAYYYEIKKNGMDNVVGKIDIRIGNNRNTFYGGNIGYSIDEEYRGNGYAYKAVLLILEIAILHKMKKVVITCNPENIASRKTAERAGAMLLDIKNLPEDNNLYKEGERRVCRYEITLN